MSPRAAREKGTAVLSRRRLLRLSVVGAAGVALPSTLWRAAGLRAAAPPGRLTAAVPHRYYVASTGPSAVRGSTIPLPLLPKGGPSGRNAGSQLRMSTVDLSPIHPSSSYSSVLRPMPLRCEATRVKRGGWFASPPRRARRGGSGARTRTVGTTACR